MHYQVIIIGSGPSGLTAGIYTSRAQLSTGLFMGSVPGGQLTKTSYVENWPGDISVTGTQLMLRMINHAKHSGADIIDTYITKANLSSKPFTFIDSQNQTYTSDSLIISTGATYKTLNIPGEEKFWTKGVSNCAVCDGLFFKDKIVAIIGGGDSAMENATFMTKVAKKVYLIHRREKLSGSTALQKRIENSKVEVLYNTTVKEICGSDTGVTHIKTAHHKKNIIENLHVDGVFINIGLSPTSMLFKDQLDLHPSGHIVNKPGTTKTSVEGVFAVGDVVDPIYRQAIVSAGFGCMAALDAERYLSKKQYAYY